MIESLKFWRLRANVLLLFALVPLRPTFGQPHCTFDEERTRRTQTGHFSIGSLTASLTLPTVVLQSAPPTVFLEVHDDDASELRQELFVEFSGEKVRLENGAALHLTHRAGERLQFTLITEDGQPLCSWQPRFLTGWRQGRPRQGPEAFSPVEAWFFRKTGDPITLWVGGGDSRQFTIDGQPAMVLSYTPWEVILRDPRPMAGLRTVVSNGYDIELRFVDIEVQFSKPSANGSATLTVRVPHLDLLGRPRCFPPYTSESTCPLMWLFNFSGDTVKIRCGKTASPSGEDADESRLIRVTGDKIRDGALVVSCPVRFRKPEPAKIYVTLFEGPPVKRAPLHLPFGLSLPR